jgi:DnaK suppressor protein
MTQLTPNLLTEGSPRFALEHYRYWQRLHEERQFRTQQLAELDAQPRGSDAHESVRTALRVAATTAVHEIDAALDRMATGRFGRCVGCGRTIPPARLDTLPMTALCMPCHFREQNLWLAARP